VLAASGAVLTIVGQLDYDTVSSAPIDSSWADYRSAWDRAPILMGTGLAALGVGVALATVGVVLGATGGNSGTEVALGPGHCSVRGRF
jgi:hypothetical protein